MNRINILPSEIFNKIAAGEVVERAASVVKELVENSIDASSSEINIEISVEDYGHKIFVSDNGVGIEKESILNAFLPHATSKISSAEDLSAITTLGFRGEALASIAAVSHVVLTTKTVADEIATAISAEGGNILEVKDAAGECGTTILVEDLFYNTPARKKFLKKPSSETGEITSCVAKIILGNPQIKIKYSINGKLVYHSLGKGLKNSIFTIYGSETLNNCLEVDYLKKNYHISGYVGKSSFYKANSTYQTFVVNGRQVTNTILLSAVKNAYKSFLMPRMYPFAVLNIIMSEKDVDVNVHPNKSDVRFSDPQIVYSAVYNAVIEALKADARQNVENFSAQMVARQNTEDIIHQKFNEVTASTFTNIESINTETKQNPQAITEIPYTTERFTVNQPLIRFNEELSQTNIQQTFLRQQEDDFNLKTIATIFDAYLLLENSKTDMVFFIDQHAAHERILFDLLIKEAEEYGKCIVQPLLLPYIFEVNASEASYINSSLQDLEIIGFLLSPFGNNAYKLEAVPTILSGIDLQSFRLVLLEDLNKGKIDAFEFNYQILARKACRAAIKANDKLTEQDIKSILKKLANNQGLTCPHGRPIVVTIKKSEIEKWFKRKL